MGLKSQYHGANNLRDVAMLLFQIIAIPVLAIYPQIGVD
jgi:hypothetical protein